jgi:non-heme Fe2+,alpha-ketoglutarate-dependent halogenase
VTFPDADALRARYRENGYLSPFRAMDEAEAARRREQFLDYWARDRVRLETLLPRERLSYLLETHIFLRWAYEIAAHPRVLDAVELALGPNVLIWSSQWFPKFPHDRAWVSWHQDATYWGLTPPNVVTAWIALAESTPENGCLRVVPGTHAAPLLPQRETYAERNMLSRGQEVAVDVDESAAVDLVLRPGEFSLHHVGIVHGSGPNRTDSARIGLAVRYISPDVVQNGRQRDMVMLARGLDREGNFDRIGPPARDFAWGERPEHTESMARKLSNILPDGER